MDKELEKILLGLWKEEGLEVTYQGPWESDHKYDTRETIVLYDDRFFAILETRSGSYFSEYDYLESDVYEVKPVQVTTTKWEPV